MPLLDELLGYPSILGTSNSQRSAPNTLPSYEELRPYLAPYLFEAMKPHFEAFERMTSPPRDAPRLIPADAAAPPTPTLLPDPAPLPSYETLRPHLDPKLFEAF